jgi:hypothetical protein
VPIRTINICSTVVGVILSHLGDLGQKAKEFSKLRIVLLTVERKKSLGAG